MKHRARYEISSKGDQKVECASGMDESRTRKSGIIKTAWTRLERTRPGHFSKIDICRENRLLGDHP